MALTGELLAAKEHGMMKGRSMEGEVEVEEVRQLVMPVLQPVSLLALLDFDLHRL
jgi:hypothetical protein